MVVNHVIIRQGGELPKNTSEFIEGFTGNIATGDQHLSLSLSKGKTRTIRSVFVYGANLLFYPNAKFDVGRGTATNHYHLSSAVYWNACTFINFDDVNFSNLGTVLGINTGSALTETIYVVVHYYYKD